HQVATDGPTLPLATPTGLEDVVVELQPPGGEHGLHRRAVPAPGPRLPGAAGVLAGAGPVDTAAPASTATPALPLGPALGGGVGRFGDNRSREGIADLRLAGGGRGHLRHEGAVGGLGGLRASLDRSI